MNKVGIQVSHLGKALKKLEEACGLEATVINQDATIKRFEFTFELAWKILQSIVRENGIDVYGPKNSLREAYRLGLIKNIEKWFYFLESRNLTVHTYEESIAQKVYKTAKEFVPSVKELLETINRKGF